MFGHVVTKNSQYYINELFVALNVTTQINYLNGKSWLDYYISGIIIQICPLALHGMMLNRHEHGLCLCGEGDTVSTE